MSPEADPAVPAEAATVPGTGAVDGEEGATTRVPGFSVTLPQFEGPFDLLLSLIARRRLDVTELALAEVTDEFIAHMRSDWDLGRASEFLVVASTLLTLKAHRLLPHDSEDEEEDLDLLEARDLLFARLLQYRAYKQAARQLSDMASAASHSHPRVVGPAPELAALLPRLVATIDATEFVHLAACAFARPAEPGIQTVHLHEQVPVGEQLSLIALRLRRHGTLTFSGLIADAERTPVVVARFLALLILHRQGSVNLDQTEPMREITVAWCGGQDDPAGIMSPDIEEEFE